MVRIHFPPAESQANQGFCPLTARSLLFPRMCGPGRCSSDSRDGYRGRDRKLVIVDSEAELLRSIFRRYAELGSVRLLKEELEAQGSKSKSSTSAAGRVLRVG